MKSEELEEIKLKADAGLVNMNDVYRLLAEIVSLREFIERNEI